MKFCRTKWIMLQNCLSANNLLILISSIMVPALNTTPIYSVKGKKRTLRAIRAPYNFESVFKVSTNAIDINLKRSALLGGIVQSELKKLKNCHERYLSSLSYLTSVAHCFGYSFSDLLKYFVPDMTLAPQKTLLLQLSKKYELSHIKAISTKATNEEEFQAQVDNYNFVVQKRWNQKRETIQAIELFLTRRVTQDGCLALLKAVAEEHGITLQFLLDSNKLIDLEHKGQKTSIYEEVRRKLALKTYTTQKKIDNKRQPKNTKKKQSFIEFVWTKPWKAAHKARKESQLLFPLNGLTSASVLKAFSKKFPLAK